MLNSDTGILTSVSGSLAPRRASMMNGRYAFIDSVNAKYRFSGASVESAASVYPGPIRTRLLGGRCAVNQNLIRGPASNAAFTCTEVYASDTPPPLHRYHHIN
ncbi:hypothetical protein CBL_00667 [Carabus blaptoides fortunei]